MYLKLFKRKDAKSEFLFLHFVVNIIYFDVTE